MSTQQRDAPAPPRGVTSGDGAPVLLPVPQGAWDHCSCILHPAAPTWERGDASTARVIPRQRMAVPLPSLQGWCSPHPWVPSPLSSPALLPAPLAFPMAAPVCWSSLYRGAPTPAVTVIFALRSACKKRKSICLETRGPSAWAELQVFCNIAMQRCHPLQAPMLPRTSCSQGCPSPLSCPWYCAATELSITASLRYRQCKGNIFLSGWDRNYRVHLRSPPPPRAHFSIERDPLQNQPAPSVSPLRTSS